MPDYSVDRNKNMKSLSTWKTDNFGSGSYDNKGDFAITSSDVRCYFSNDILIEDSDSLKAGTLHGFGMAITNSSTYISIYNYILPEQSKLFYFLYPDNTGSSFKFKSKKISEVTYSDVYFDVENIPVLVFW